MIYSRGSNLRTPTLHNAGEYQRRSVCSGRFICVGVWRSLVARTAGGREVAGSSPVTPTIEKL